MTMHWASALLIFIGRVIAFILKSVGVLTILMGVGNRYLGIQQDLCNPFILVTGCTLGIWILLAIFIMFDILCLGCFAENDEAKIVFNAQQEQRLSNDVASALHELETHSQYYRTRYMPKYHHNHNYVHNNSNTKG
jgi:hypothetical protein